MSTSTLKIRAKLAYKPESEWASTNPVLLAGELAVSSDKKGMYKTGDGKSAWSSLTYNESGTVNGHTILSNVPANAKFTDTVYSHPNSGAAAGTYRSVTVNAQGHVTAGSNPVLTVAQGGTGSATAAGALVNLGISAAAAELNYVKGVTGSVQTQLNGKAPASHSHAYLPLSGGTVTGTLTLSRSADASGTADNKPALLVGAASTGQHLELDGNEILSKSNGTTPAALNLNTDGGLVSVGSGGIKSTGAVTAPSFAGNLNGNASTASALSAARTLKIGNTGKNFNGSAGLTWTLAEIGAAASGHTHNNATASANGLMSASDKKKLDGVAAGAQKNTVTGVKGNAESAYRTGNINLTPANLGAAAASHAHSYVPLTGGTMTGPLKSSYITGTHLKGNQGNALVASTAAKSSYVAFLRYPSTNGIFTLCGYQTGFNMYYTANTTVAAGTNGVTKSAVLLNESGNTSLPGALTVAGTIKGSKVYNAVYNDLAEWFLKKDPAEKFAPGDVVCWDGTGVTRCTKDADFSAVGVYSDSYGQILGGEELEDMEDNIIHYLPIGLAGRVRVKVSGTVHYGDALVSSSIPGTARADNSAHPNAIIGKALEEQENDDTVHMIQMLIR